MSAVEPRSDSQVYEAQLLGEALSRQEASCRRAVEAIDALMVAAAAQALHAFPGVALAAAGSYGRGELMPDSDLDLIVFGETLEASDVCAARRIERALTTALKACYPGPPPKIEVSYLGAPERVAALVRLHATTMRDLRPLCGPSGYVDRYLEAIQRSRAAVVRAARLNLQDSLRARKDDPAPDPKTGLGRWLVYELSIRALETDAPARSSFQRLGLVEDPELRVALERGLSAYFWLRSRPLVAPALRASALEDLVAAVHRLRTS